MREFERIRCPGCQREIAAYVPKHGDGSGLRLTPHHETPSMKARPCAFSRRLVVRDRGVWRLA